MRHLITTRIKFTDDELLKEYLEISKRSFIPSLLSQTNKNFTLGIISNEQHREMIISFINDLSVKLNKEKPSLVFFDDKTTDYVDYVKNENINIQTRHDCDDWMCNTYVEDIQNTYLNNINQYESFVIHVQPYKYDILNDKTYTMSLRYDDSRTSMFASLCQKNCNESIFSVIHRDIGGLGQKVFMLKEGSCYLVIHDNNISSVLFKTDKLNKSEELDKQYDISIVVPTFNNTHYIDECIDSLMESSNGLKYEILVGIDGCQKTYDHLKDKSFPENVKIFYFKENRGPYLIKNSLANIASSENILFFDSDDVMLKSSVSFLNDLSHKFEVIKFRLMNFIGDFSVSNTKGKSIFAEGVFFIKKSLFLSMNGFEPWMCAADSDFMARLYKKKLKIHFTDEILFHRRIHTENLTKRGDTGLGSKLRASYWKISKNKKGDGNPDSLSLSEFVPILNHKPIEPKVYVETEEELNEKRIRQLRKETLEKINNKTKVVEQEVKLEKKPFVIDYDKINNLLKNRVHVDPKPRVVNQNKPDDRQTIIDQKTMTNKKTIEMLLPSKKNRRNGDPIMNIGGKFGR